MKLKVYGNSRELGLYFSTAWQPHISKLQVVSQILVILIIPCLDISYEELNTFPPNWPYQILKTMP